MYSTTPEQLVYSKSNRCKKDLIVAARVFGNDFGTGWDVIDIVVVPNVVTAFRATIVDTNTVALLELMRMRK